MKSRVSEKTEQSHGIQLLRSIGAAVYVIGHPSPKDGRTHRGTGQTPGIPDVFAVLKPQRFEDLLTVEARWKAQERGYKMPAVALWWEAKAHGGRLSTEQITFRELCVLADLWHVVGPLDALIAALAGRGYTRTDAFPHYRHPKESAV